MPALRLIPKLLLASDLKLLLDGVDIGERRQAGLVAEPLDLVGRCRAGKLEMVLPAFAGILEIRKHVSAVKHVTGAVGIEHALARDRQRRHGANRAGLVVPEQATLAHRNAADAATASLEIFQHLWRCQVHLL